MNMRKLTTIAAASAMAIAPTAANSASALSLAQAPAARAGAETEDASRLNGSTPVLIGVILIVLFAWVVISNNRGEPGPNSP